MPEQRRETNQKGSDLPPLQRHVGNQDQRAEKLFKFGYEAPSVPSKRFSRPDLTISEASDLKPGMSFWQVNGVYPPSMNSVECVVLSAPKRFADTEEGQRKTFSEADHLKDSMVVEYYRLDESGQRRLDWDGKPEVNQTFLSSHNLAPDSGYENDNYLCASRENAELTLQQLKDAYEAHPDIKQAEIQRIRGNNSAQKRLPTPDCVIQDASVLKRGQRVWRVYGIYPPSVGSESVVASKPMTYAQAKAEELESADGSSLGDGMVIKLLKMDEDGGPYMILGKPRVETTFLSGWNLGGPDQIWGNDNYLCASKEDAQRAVEQLAAAYEANPYAKARELERQRENREESRALRRMMMPTRGPLRAPSEHLRAMEAIFDPMPLQLEGMRDVRSLGENWSRLFEPKSGADREEPGPEDTPSAGPKAP
jgi:hypothetical protein